MTSIGPAQMSNKLNNLIIIVNNNLFNLNNKINYNINYDIYQIFFYHIFQMKFVLYEWQEIENWEDKCKRV
jgi:hypothetical protein